MIVVEVLGIADIPTVALGYVAQTVIIASARQLLEELGTGEGTYVAGG